MSDVPGILTRLEAGDSAAAEELLPLVYNELRRVAAALLASEKPGQTLQPTALVHEAYLRLVGPGGRSQESGVRVQQLTPDPCPLTPVSFNSRTHFFAAAAEAMRRILVDQARRKDAVKHGGQFTKHELTDEAVAATAPPEEVLAVNEYFDRFAAEDPLAAELVKLHYYAGFSVEEAGQHLGLSRATAYRLWTYAKAWFKANLTDDQQI